MTKVVTDTVTTVGTASNAARTLEARLWTLNLAFTRLTGDLNGWHEEGYRAHPTTPLPLDGDPRRAAEHLVQVDDLLPVALDLRGHLRWPETLVTGHPDAPGQTAPRRARSSI